jgi:tetratricopeptide (TPR) repeat protein
MHSYGVADVEKLLRLPRRTITALVKAGFVTPARGPRRALRFSFQDLIVLRTAQALAEARIPAARITRSLKALRRQLPETMPLSGLSIGAAGNQVVVRDARGRRQAESGQYLLAFEGDPGAGAMRVVEPRLLPRVAPAGAPPDAAPEPDDWHERGLELEHAGDRDGAIHAYQRAVAEDPSRADAHINLGRLLHEAGRLAQAEAAYRAGLRGAGADAVLLFNLGVLLEDRSRPADAVRAYEAAVAADPALADGHYNLALLCHRLRRPREALRHMSQYRRLTLRRPQ